MPNVQFIIVDKVKHNHDGWWVIIVTIVIKHLQVTPHLPHTWRDTRSTLSHTNHTTINTSWIAHHAFSTAKKFIYWRHCIYIWYNTREAFKNYLQKTYGIFPIWGGLGGLGGSGGVIFHMFSAIHQNASKAFLSHFRHFYFFPLQPSNNENKTIDAEIYENIW